MRTPEVAPRHNTGYSYAHAHITQIKNAREHCVHVTDHSGWRFSTTHKCEFGKGRLFSHKCEMGKRKVKYIIYFIKSLSGVLFLKYSTSPAHPPAMEWLPSRNVYSVDRSDVTGMTTRWKQCYVRPPSWYFIVLANSVKTSEVKVIEFHRIGLYYSWAYL